MRRRRQDSRDSNSNSRMNIRVLILAAAVAFAPAAAFAGVVKGKVTCDGKPVAGVQVSDGQSIVRTDARGNYRLVSAKADSMVFITTPSGYVAKGLDSVRPGFWAMLTEPASKTEVHDFQLEPQDQTNYSILFITDCHFANDPSRNDLSEFSRTIMPLVKTEYAKASEKGPVYVFNLGDFTHDLYWYDFGFPGTEAVEFLCQQGFPGPMYAISGNHDNDAGIAYSGENTDFISAWNWRRAFGPDRYAVNIGKDHWVVLDDVIYENLGEPNAKHRNMKGGRSYRCRYTESQLEWLKKDLESVSPDTRVFLCSHVPVLNEPLGTERIEQTQLDTLDAIFSKFEKVYVYSGHTHKMVANAAEGSKYTRFKPFVFPATSGNMWQNPKGFPAIGTDGCDNGISIMDCSVSDPKPYYITAKYGHKLMRCYDLNAVAEYFASDKQCKALAKAAPKRKTFSEAKFKNGIMVNYWGLQEGDKVEMFEYGESLDVKKVSMDEPLYLITYVAPKVKKDGTIASAEQKERKNTHLFMATAKYADSPVVVRVTDADGNIVCKDVLVRPKPFGRDAR